MSNHIVRVLSREAGVRGLACITTDLTREAQRRHQTLPVATAALGYGLTAGVLLGALLKVQQRVALKIQGNGPLQKMVVEGDSYGRVRGYVAEPAVPWPLPIGPEDVAEALGRQGLLTVVKDLRLKNLYEGVVSLESGQLDQDLMHYLNTSEQVPSLVEIGVRLDDRGDLLTAGGLLVQLMPDRDPVIISDIAQRSEDLPPLSQLLMDGWTPEGILDHLLAGTNHELLETRPLEFRCFCSRERSRMALTVLHREDLEALLDEGEAIIDCHFCHERYTFGPSDLMSILDEIED